MSGSDMGDDHKEYFAGEAALKAAGKDNTMNQFWSQASVSVLPHIWHGAPSSRLAMPPHDPFIGWFLIINPSANPVKDKTITKKPKNILLISKIIPFIRKE